MRRPVRPFVTEFKTRSASAAPAARPATRLLVEPPPDAEQPPSYPDIDVFQAAPMAARPGTPSDSYEAAMKAADAVFGRHFDVPPAAPSPSTGRVLPSLVETDLFSGRAPVQEEVKKRRGRPPGKGNKPKIVDPDKPKAKRGRPPGKRNAPKHPVIHVAVAAPVVVPEPLPEVASFAEEIQAPVRLARQRRPIQERWVLKTELKAGENWKRRLCKAARKA